MNNFVKSVGVFIIGLLFVVSGAWLSDKVRKRSTLETPRSIVDCPSDFIHYSSLSNNEDRTVKLISKETSMFASGGKFVNPQVVITQNKSDKSEMACGYLFIRTGTKNYGPLQNWEDVYINPTGFGGHVSIDNAISVNEGEEYSEYLIPLERVMYWRTKLRTSKLNANWVALLNVSVEVPFGIGLNTNNQNGFIDEISITYKCWNPTTGEENNNCQLVVKEVNDRTTNSLEK